MGTYLSTLAAYKFELTAGKLLEALQQNKLGRHDTNAKNKLKTP
jgi:hypothetical protein